MRMKLSDFNYELPKELVAEYPNKNRDEAKLMEQASAINAHCDIRGDKLNFLNVGMGKDISIKDLAFKIAKACNFKGRIIWDDSKPDGTPRKLLNISRINNLGWSAQIELEDCIKSTIDVFKKEIL